MISNLTIFQVAWMRSIIVNSMLIFALILGNLTHTIGQIYQNDFETATGTNNWATTTIVASGTNGVPSFEGVSHGVLPAGAFGATTSSFTHWGQYNSVFPEGGYRTKVRIYLDVNPAFQNDRRFDFSSAVSTPANTFRRDFVFNVGYYNDETGPGANTNRYVISVSNNAGRSNSFPKNPGRNPISIQTSGWYTFEHTFANDNGTLSVTLSIYDAADNLIHSFAPLSDVSDIIGSTVGGNRYGWILNNELGALPIDLAQRIEDTGNCGEGVGGAFVGNITISTQTQLDAFVDAEGRKYSSIVGNLTLDGNGNSSGGDDAAGDDPLTDLCNISELISISGNLTIRDFGVVGNPTAIGDFTALATVGGNINLGGNLTDGNGLVTSFTFPALSGVGGSISVRNNALLSEVVMGSLAFTGQTTSFLVQSNPLLTSVLAGISSIANNVNIDTNGPNVTMISLPHLTSVGNNFDLSNNAANATQSNIHVPLLASVGNNFNVGRAAGTFGNTALMSVGGNFTFANNILMPSGSLDFAGLQTIGGSINVSNNENLIGLTLGTSAFANTNSTILVSGNSSLVSVSIGSTSTSGNVSITNNGTSLTSIGLPFITSAGGNLNFNNNASNDVSSVNQILLPNLTQVVGNLNIGRAAASVDASQLLSVLGNFSLTNNQAFTNFDTSFPSITNVGGDLNVSNNPNLSDCCIINCQLEIVGNTTINNNKLGSNCQNLAAVQASCPSEILTYYADEDGDTYGDPNTTYTGCFPPAGYVLISGDCDDTDSAINPGAVEACDGIDNNCDGQIDEGCQIAFVSGNGNPILNGSLTVSTTNNTDFGSLAVTGAKSLSYQITNMGTFPLTLNGETPITISGDGVANFTLLTTVGETVLNPSQSISFTIQYTAGSLGLHEATVSIANDDEENNPYTFTIRGAGSETLMQVRGNNVTIPNGSTTISTANFTDFGTINLNSTRTRTFSVFNLGTQTLLLTGSPAVTISGADADLFVVTAQPITTVGPGQQRFIQIRYTGSRSGVHEAFVTIENNDVGTNPYTFKIGATVNPGIAQVRGNNLIIENNDVTPNVSDFTDFGTIGVGANKINTFYVRNIGTGTLLLTGTPRVVISGANADQFTVTTQPVASLSPNGNTLFRIRYNPTAAGKHTATIQIQTSDAGASTYSFDVTGSTFLPLVAADADNENAFTTEESDDVQVRAEADLSASISLGIYPNPVQDFAILNIKGVDQPYQIRIADFSGRIVWSNTFTGEELRVDLEQLQAGVYLVTLVSQDIMKTVKFVKL